MIIKKIHHSCRRRRTKEWGAMTPQEGKERGLGAKGKIILFYYYPKFFNLILLNLYFMVILSPINLGISG
jgi:hypothetical protein